MDQKQMQLMIQAGLNQCFGMMNDPTKFYAILPCSLGDLLMSGGLMHAMPQKFGKQSVVLLAHERFSSFEVAFDGVSEIKYLPQLALSAMREYVNATKQFITANYAFGHFRFDDKRNFVWSKELHNSVDRYKHDVYDLPLDTPFRNPIVKDISTEAKVRLNREYIIDKNRTVILAPYANSMRLMSPNFWLRLAAELNRRGFVVYTNVGKSPTGMFEPPLQGTRPINVSLNEIFFLADKLRCFVSFRSGLCDLLAFANTHLICLRPQTVDFADDMKVIFPNTPSRIDTLYFDFEFFPKINALLEEHNVSGMQIGAIKHKAIPDGRVFWNEDALLAAILRAVEAQ